MKHILPNLLLLGVLFTHPLQAALTHDPALHWNGVFPLPSSNVA